MAEHVAADWEDYAESPTTPDVYLGVGSTAPEAPGFGYTPGPALATPPTIPSFYDDYFALEQGLVSRQFREDELSDKEMLMVGIGRGQVAKEQLSPAEQTLLAPYPDQPSFWNRFKREMGQGFEAAGRGGIEAVRQLLPPFARGILPEQSPVESGVWGAVKQAASPLETVTGPLQMFNAPIDAAA